MNPSPARLRTYLILGAIGVTILLGLFLLLSLRFRITSSTPDTNNYPSSLGVLKFTFNRKLNAEAIQKQFAADNQSVVKFSFESISQIEVSDDTLLLTIGRTPLPGNYSIKLANITATDGSVFSSTIPLSVKQIPYEKLSPEARRLYDEAALSGEENDNDPLKDILPHETSQYKISYALPPEGVELPPTITITMKFFEPGDVALPATPQQTQQYKTDVRSVTKEALSYLSSRGVDVSKYVMSYTEPSTRSEFPVGYQAAPPPPGE